MNEHRIVEEREIVITDLLWRLAEQWRAIVATGLIFAILLTGLKYIVDVRAYDSAVKAQSEQDAIRASLAQQDENEGDETDVDEALFLSVNEGDEKALAEAEEEVENTDRFEDEKTNTTQEDDKADAADTETAAAPLAGAKANLAVRPGTDGSLYLERIPTEGVLLRSLTYYDQYKDMEDYYNESLLMRVNSENETRLYMLFYVEPTEKSETTAFVTANMYARLLYNDDFLHEVSKALGLDTEVRYFKELFNIFLLQDDIVSQEQTAGKGFGVTLILSGAEDYEAVEKALTDQFQAAKAEIEKTAGAHKLKKMTCSVSTINDLDTRALQNDAYNRMISCANNFEKSYDLLAAEEKASVDKVIIDGSVKKILSDYRAGRETGDPLIDHTDPLGNKPSVSKTALIAGFILGVLLYAFLYLLGILLIHRIRGEKDVEKATGLRSFGGVYTYPWRGAWNRFLHSKAIYTLRHKKKGRPEEAADRIARAIAAKASHDDIKKISMIVLGDSNRWADGILSRQKRLLAKEYEIEAERIHNFGSALSLDEDQIRRLNPACLVLLSGTTTPAMTADLLTRLQEYRIPVLGTEFLEGA